jgi:hypothetical protein
MTEKEVIELAKKAGVPVGFRFEWPNRVECLSFELQAFARLVEYHKSQELADKIEAMPFGDTASSFAQWVREQA